MQNSFKQRLAQYLRWWLKKTQKSPKITNLIIVVVLSIGLIVIGLFDQKPQAQVSEASFSSYPIRLPCTVERIIDGDSIIAKCPTKKGGTKLAKRSIRVFGIDAPELRQKKWGAFAKKKLVEIIGNSKQVELEFLEQDRYQRFVAKVYVNGNDAGLEMIKQGAAIVYHRYNKERDYINAEKKAKMGRLGIWATKGAHQNPEKWRRFNP